MGCDPECGTLELDQAPPSPIDSIISELDRRPCLPSEPMDDVQAALVRKATSVPRLLFRAASERSRGGPFGNSMTMIDPLHPTPKYHYDHDGEYYDSFTSMPWERANVMINSHLRWVYDRPSGFSSWSSSLLDALMHAARRRDEKQENVLIYVLDTTKIKHEGCIYSATKLMKVFKQDKQPNGKMFYERAIGEHLVYGRLTADDGFIAVPFDSLLNAGLFDILKSLDSTVRREHDVNQVHKNMKLIRLYYVRKRHVEIPKRIVKGPVLQADGTEYWPFLSHLMPILRALGRCFGPSWEATMTIAFACTRRRNVHPDSKDFDLAPLLLELDGLAVQHLGDEHDVDVDTHELREDYVQMVQVWKLMEELQNGTPDWAGRKTFAML